MSFLSASALGGVSPLSGQYPIEHQPLIVRTVVQANFSVLVNGNFAHADARMREVDPFPVFI